MGGQRDGVDRGVAAPSRKPVVGLLGQADRQERAVAGEAGRPGHLLAAPIDEIDTTDVGVGAVSK